MTRQSHSQKQIAAFSPALSGFSLSSKPNALSFAHPARDFHLIGFNLLRSRPPQRNLPRRSMESFLKTDHDIGFNIAPALRCALAMAKSAKSRAATTTSKKRLKEIAETSSTEFEVDAASIAPTPLVIAPRLRTAAPIWWRLKSARLIPIRAKLIVFLPFLGVAQDFIGF